MAERSETQEEGNRLENLSRGQDVSVGRTKERRAGRRTNNTDTLRCFKSKRF